MGYYIGASKLTLIPVIGSTFTWFFMCAIEIDLGLSVGIEFALFFVRGPKSTSVLCAGRKVLGLNLWIEIDFVFSVGIEIVLFFVCGPKMTCF